MFKSSLKYFSKGGSEISKLINLAKVELIMSILVSLVEEHQNKLNGN